MPNLVERLGARPILIATGGVALGGVGISSALFIIGILSLCAVKGVPLPGALGSLAHLTLPGGIAFTASGVVLSVATTGFFIFMVRQVRVASRLSVSHPDETEHSESEEAKISPASMEELYQDIDDHLTDIQNNVVNEGYYTKGSFFSFWVMPKSKVKISLKAKLAVDFDTSSLWDDVGDHLSKQYPDLKYKIVEDYAIFDISSGSI